MTLLSVVYNINYLCNYSVIQYSNIAILLIGLYLINRTLLFIYCIDILTYY